MNWYKLLKISAIKMPYDPEYEYLKTGPPNSTGNTREDIQKELLTNNPRAYGKDPEENKYVRRKMEWCEKRADQIINYYKNFITKSVNDIIGNATKPTKYFWRKATSDISQEVTEAEMSSDVPDNLKFQLSREIGGRVVEMVDNIFKQKFGYSGFDASTNHLTSGDHADDRPYMPYSE